MAIRVLLLLGMLLLSTNAVRAAECCGDGPGAAVAATNAATGSYLSQWATKFSNWAKNFEFLTNIIGLFNIFDRTIDNDLDVLGTGINAGQKAQTEAKIRAAQGLSDTNAQTAAAAMQGMIAGQLTPPPITDKQLCRLIKIRQGQGIASWWEKSVSVATAEMIANRYRGPGTDGSGPQYTADMRQQRCALKTGNPLDGGEDDCLATDPAMVDADISYDTVDGTQVLEMPDTDTQTVPVAGGSDLITHVLKPANQEQNLYKAAVNYCAFAAGPRPTPPYGADLDSPQGIVAMALFNRAAALESAFVTQCANRIAKLTRPDCKSSSQLTNPGVKKYCLDTIMQCNKFVETGGTLPPDIKSCDDGLSPYQKEYISHLSCMADQRYISGAGAGASHGNMLDSSVGCQLSYTAWQAQLTREKGNLIKAFQGLQDMQETYAGTAAQTGKIIRIKAPVPEDNKTPHYQSVKSKKVSFPGLTIMQP